MTRLLTIGGQYTIWVVAGGITSINVIPMLAAGLLKGNIAFSTDPCPWGARIWQYANMRGRR
jgi:hypothetical protein